jgi:mannose-6-phosphate isomerase-like protein (cupin superfamily)
MRVLKLASEQGADVQEPRFEELLRVPALSVGRYRLPVGAQDPQLPHGEDEIYVVRSGQGVLRTPSGDAQAVPGAVLFVSAGEEHRFVEVTRELDLLVIFAPAEHTAGSTAAEELE